SLPSTPSVHKPDGPAKPDEPQKPGEHPQDELPRIPQESVLNVIAMFRPGSTGGGGGASGGAPSGGGTGTGGGRQSRGGAQRSAARSASTAGRAAAAAYALRTGDAAVLRALGLDYEQLRANPDPVDVA